jgi:hypothetical protein
LEPQEKADFQNSVDAVRELVATMDQLMASA